MNYKIILAYFIFLSSFDVVMGYATTIEHDNVRWKFYNDSINKSQYYEVMDKFLPYTEGLRHIEVHNKKFGDSCGLYFWPVNIIKLSNECFHTYGMDWIIAHELAHLKDYQYLGYLGFIKRSNHHDEIFEGHLHEIESGIGH